VPGVVEASRDDRPPRPGPGPAPVRGGRCGSRAPRALELHPMMRRRRGMRQARGQWVYGMWGPVARLVGSQAAFAAAYPRTERILDLLELAPGRRYLDVGCGTASFAHLLARTAGMDEAPVSVDFAAEPGPVDAIAWPEKLPFADNSFDAIT